MATNTYTIFRVHFHEPRDNKQDFYFGSLKAIYSKFTPEEIGCALQSLYSAKIRFGNYKATEKCVVSKHEVVRKKNNRGEDIANSETNY